MPHQTVLPVIAAGLLVAAMTGCAASTPQESDPDRGLLFRELTLDGAEHKYAVYVPRSYDPATPSPAILFLHGRGECGTDGQRQAGVGLIPAAILDPEAWPFIIVAPQKPDPARQWSDFDALAMAALAKTESEFAIDASRVSLTGLSQGGAGTWALAAAHPDRWAAIAPVCGYGDPAAIAPHITALPTWAFHGLKDDVVPPERTESIAAAIRDAGGDPKVTIFPDANHNAWDPAYRSSGLGAWLLERRRE